MTGSKRICIHHNHAVAPAPGQGSEMGHIIIKTLSGTLHHHSLGSLPYQMKSERAEHFLILRLCEHRYKRGTGIPSYGIEMRDESGSYILSAQFFGESETLYGVPLQSAATHKSVIGVIDSNQILKLRIEFKTHSGKDMRGTLTEPLRIKRDCPEFKFLKHRHQQCLI